jgi:hypothetical protein
MKTPLKILAVAVLALALLFTGPIVYRAGQRVSLYLNCDQGYSTILHRMNSDAENREVCWQMAGYAVMHGGRLPR